MSAPDPLSRRAAERARMVREQLAERGIRDARVLEAMNRIPREIFVPPAEADEAYADSALGIACAQTISQPYMVARMTELLDPLPIDRVLEVGTGSGYQTAVLAVLVERVYTVELHEPLMNEAAARLESLGIANVEFLQGDGTLGWPEHAPYDGIIVTAGAPTFPATLAEQVRVYGRLVVPIGSASEQVLKVIRRTETGFSEEDVLPCRFVKLVGAEGWKA